MTPGLGDHHERRSEPANTPNRSAGNLDDGARYGPNGSSGITTDDIDADYDRLMSYSDSVDYYSLLGLPRNPPPTDAQLRSAYRSLSLSFYPDKHPSHMSEIATQQYDRIREAYETLIDDKKRVVYDLLGEDGVREEWGVGGTMRSSGTPQSQEVGIRAMPTDEFRRWFLNTMRSRERRALESMVQGRGSITVGVDASTMFSMEDDDVYLSIPTVKASSFSLGYNFKIPLPPFKGFWTWRSDVEEEEDEDTPKTNDNERPPILSLNARLGGKLQRPKQRIKVENEETGEIENIEVDLPPMVLSRNLTLGASLAHTFQDVGASGGILSRYPFSWLSQSSVNVGCAFFPAPAIQTSILKSVVPVKGTRPFQLSLQSTFQNSIFHFPPSFDFQVAREISAQNVAYCSWSTGTLYWPDIVSTLLAPLFALGPEESAYLESPSKFSIGVVHTPQQQEHELPEDDDEDEDAGGLGDSGDTQPANHANAKFDPHETWSFDLNTSPDGESISFNYGRNIFSRQPDKPLLSEWSAENHHSPQISPISRPVRLQIQTSVSSDLSLAWTVSGSRRVTDFTRMGFGVGVQGNRGLVFSVSWNRLGQSIRIPIAICPLKVLNYDIGALAVIFPWATYTAVEFGILRPRERRRRQRAIARRRKELKKLTLKRKEESSQATRLMSDQVKRRQAKEEESQGLVIRRAEYGHFPPPNGKKGTEDAPNMDQVIDVTIPVAALVDKRQLIISKQVIKPQILGFYDPAPLIPKKLKIWYQFGGQDHFVEVHDAEGVTCPMRAHMVSL